MSTAVRPAQFLYYLVLNAVAGALFAGAAYLAGGDIKGWVLLGLWSLLLCESFINAGGLICAIPAQQLVLLAQAWLWR